MTKWEIFGIFSGIGWFCLMLWCFFGPSTKETPEEARRAKAAWNETPDAW